MSAKSKWRLGNSPMSSIKSSTAHRNESSYYTNSYLEKARRLLLPNLENTIHSVLTEFVYNPDSRYARQLPRLKRCFDAAAEWVDPLDVFLSKYKDIGVKEAMIRNAIGYLIKDGLVAHFVDSVILNRRLNRACRELDSLGIEQNILRTMNVWNFINERNYCSHKNYPLSTTNVPEEYSSDLETEIGSYKESVFRGRTCERSANCATFNEEINCTGLRETQRHEGNFSNFLRPNSEMWNFKNTLNIPNAFPADSRKIYSQKSRLVLSYAAKHPRMNWKDSKLKIVISKSCFDPSRPIISKPLRISHLSLPCKPCRMIVEIFEADESLSKSCLILIKRKFESNISHACFRLNNILRNLDGKVIGKFLRLNCKIRSGNISFTLDIRSAKKLQICYFVARVPICSNFDKSNFLQQSRRRISSVNSKDQQEQREDLRIADICSENCNKTMTEDNGNYELSTANFYSPCSNFNLPENINTTGNELVKADGETDAEFSSSLKLDIRVVSFVENKEACDSKVKMLKDNVELCCCTENDKRKEYCAASDSLITHSETNANTNTRNDHEDSLIAMDLNEMQRSDAICDCFSDNNKNDMENGHLDDVVANIEKRERTYNQDFHCNPCVNHITKIKSCGICANISNEKETFNETNHVCCSCEDILTSEEKYEIVSPVIRGNISNNEDNFNEAISVPCSREGILENEEKFDGAESKEKYNGKCGAKVDRGLNSTNTEDECDSKCSCDSLSYGIFNSKITNEPENLFSWDDSKNFDACDVSKQILIHGMKNDISISVESSHDITDSTVCIEFEDLTTCDDFSEFNACDMSKEISMKRMENNISVSVETLEDKSTRISCNESKNLMKYNDKPNQISICGFKNGISLSIETFKEISEKKRRDEPKSLVKCDNFTEFSINDIPKRLLIDGEVNQISVSIQTSQLEMISKSVNIDIICPSLLPGLAIDNYSQISNSERKEANKNCKDNGSKFETAGSKKYLITCGSSKKSEHTLAHKIKLTKRSKVKSQISLERERFADSPKCYSRLGNRETPMTSKMSRTSTAEWKLQKASKPKNAMHFATAASLNLSRNFHWKDPEILLKCKCDSRETEDRYAEFSRNKNRTLRKSRMSNTFSNSFPGKSIEQIKSLIRRKLQRVLLKSRDTETCKSMTFLKNDKYLVSVSRGKMKGIALNYADFSAGNFPFARNHEEEAETSETLMSRKKSFTRRKEDVLKGDAKDSHISDVLWTLKNGNLVETSDFLSRCKRSTMGASRKKGCYDDKSLKKSVETSGGKYCSSKDFSERRHLKAANAQPIEKIFVKDNSIFKGANKIQHGDENCTTNKPVTGKNQSNLGHNKFDYCRKECHFSNVDSLNNCKRNNYKTNTMTIQTSDDKNKIKFSDSSTSKEVKNIHNLHYVKTRDFRKCSKKFSQEESIEGKTGFVNFTSSYEKRINDLSIEFRLKLLQYVTLCKTVKDSLIKKLRPDDIYEGSTTSVSCSST